MGILLLRLYLVLNADAELGEEVPKLTLEDFGSNMILIGELVLCTMIMFLAVICGLNLDDFIFLSNQLFVYNKAILDMMKSKNIEIDADHKRRTLFAELDTIGTCIASTILPFGVAACIFHPIEPNHRLVEDWLEIEVGFQSWFTIVWISCLSKWGDAGMENVAQY
ncbi:unnamed protein product [Orchesella dallaii]|uniref:Uncharacterized protein n=1 Tax=Orchesella dallaii TaxID=48710 RepID=A0ABP1RGX3_9HEXA